MKGDETRGYFRCPLTRTCNDLLTLVIDKLHVETKGVINGFRESLIDSGFAWSLEIASISFKISFNHTAHGGMYFKVYSSDDTPWYLSNSYILFFILGKRKRRGKFS